ncbi:TonB-dependent receptor [Changchengzhania lutea]|uniref:TonB-dependent receptor n=1 Tax=Changchengzhania lutea TaxID=2049305 RepID=UPI00115D022F|nr:TonB-dependent receptor [Changchengzhania lutea]
MNIKIKDAFLGVLFFLLTFSLAVAQTIVKGTVTDNTNMPLPDVNVSLKGTFTGTTTDFNGNFVIELLSIKDAILMFSSLGFKNQEIIVNEPSTLLIVILETDISQLDDIIITANRTTQSSQNVAQSVSVLSSKTIQRSGAREFRDYASGIPNLSFGSQGGDGGGRFSNEITIRGIAGHNTTALYLNGAPLPERINPNLIDISRIEVLKGPQGTLYGSATMGGAIKVISNIPQTDKISGFAESEIATVKEGDADYNIQGLLNIPITKNLAFRGSGYYNFQSGIYDRVVNQDIEWLNSDAVLTEDFYGDTEDYFGNPFAIETNGCEGCSRENKENLDDRFNYGFNANLGFYPTDDLSIIATVIHQKLKGDGYDFAESNVDSFIQNSNTGLGESFKDGWTNYSLQAELETKSGTFISSTNFLNRAIIETEDASDINTYYWIAYDDDPGVVPLESIWGATTDRSIDTELFQQEIRFNSDFEGKFNFLAGVFYSSNTQYWNYKDDSKGLATYLLSDNAWYEDAYWGETEADYAYILNNNDLPWYAYDGDFHNSEFALFGQFYYDFTDTLKFTLGLRYFNATSDQSTNENGADFGFVNKFFKAKFSEDGVNPKFNLTYKITKDKLVYATVARGFRIGDANESLPLFVLEELEALDGEYVREYDADYLWNYELGFKSAWLNGKIIANIALFYNNWNDLQQYRLLPSGWGYTANVGSAHTVGLELDFRKKISKNFEFGFGLGLLSPEIDEGSLALTASKGDKILNSPSVTGNLNAEYNKVLSNNNTIYATAGLQYVGERFGTYEPELEPELIFPEYTLLNARVGYVFSNFEVAVFGRNLTNKQANFGNIQSFGAILPGRQRYSTNRPLTMGLNLKYKF